MESCQDETSKITWISWLIVLFYGGSFIAELSHFYESFKQFSLV